jgi:hypothetical protein
MQSLTESDWSANDWSASDWSANDWSANDWSASVSLALAEARLAAIASWKLALQSWTKISI